ncbi:MAG: YfhO family protein [Actinomycetota bacterium]|nr:YfhO family protein [Actinomycetota bacterium]
MNEKERWNKKDWIAIGILFGLVVLGWFKAIFLQGYSFGVEGDFIRQFYPARFFAVESLKKGTFPLWCPYLLGGHPFLASYQTAMFYPPNFLMLISYALAGAQFTVRALNIFVVLHFFMAGVFTYILLRDFGIGRGGSLIGGITYMFSGCLVAHAGHVNQVSAASWVPLIFFFFNRSLEKKKFSYAVAAGIVFGISLLSGHLQPLLYLGFFLALFIFYHGIKTARETRGKGFLFALGSLCVMVVVGAALASVQLLPTYEFTKLSVRSEIPFSMASTFSLPPKQVITLLFPHFYGTNPDVYIGAWEGMWEVYGYAGIVSGALAVIAFLDKKHRKFTIFLWIALVLSVVLALGPEGYLFTALYHSRFLFNKFRCPARALLLFGFTVSLLSGIGTNYLIRFFPAHKKKRNLDSATRLLLYLFGVFCAGVTCVALFLNSRGEERALANGFAMRSMVMPTVFFAVLVAFVFIVRLGKLDPGVLATGILVLVAVDLLAFNVPWVIKPIEQDSLYKDACACRYISRYKGPFRVETDAATLYECLDNGAIYGVEKSSGDDSLIFKDYVLYRNIVSLEWPGVQKKLFSSEGIKSPLLDAMNDLFFISADQITPSLAEGKFDFIGQFEGVNVYRNRHFVPRARLADALTVKDKDAALRIIEQTRGKCLEGPALLALEGERGMKEGEFLRATPGCVQVAKYESNRVVIETDPSCRGLLVLSDVCYPGWEVFVDGKREQIHRANYLFRGVILEGGQKKVEFRFSPRSFRVGAIISVAALVFLAIYGLYLFIARRKWRFEA